MSSSAGRRIVAIEKHLESKENTNDRTTMAGLEDVLAEAVKAQKVPQAVVYATNKDGEFVDTGYCTILVAKSKANQWCRKLHLQTCRGLDIRRGGCRTNR